MEPLSTSLAVLSAITASGQGLNKLLSLRKAPVELQALSNEVETLRGLLLIVQLSLDGIEGLTASEDCEEAISILLDAT